MLAGGSAHLLLGDDLNSGIDTCAAHCYLYSISCIHVENIQSHAQTYTKYINHVGFKYENLESDKGVNGERSEVESIQASFLLLVNP